MGRDQVASRASLYKDACSGRGTHLCGTDDGLPSSVAPTNHHLLGKEDLLCRDLNAQITTRHHDPITGFQDLVKPDRQVAETEVIQTGASCTVAQSFLGFSDLAILAPGQVPMTSSQGCSSCLSPPKGPTVLLAGLLQHQDARMDTSLRGRGGDRGLLQNPMGSLPLFSLFILH